MAMLHIATQWRILGGPNFARKTKCFVESRYRLFEFALSCMNRRSTDMNIF